MHTKAFFQSVLLEDEEVVEFCKVRSKLKKNSSNGKTGQEKRSGLVKTLRVRMRLAFRLSQKAVESTREVKTWQKEGAGFRSILVILVWIFQGIQDSHMSPHFEGT